jgi:formiminotetrahydrofolate cyclodeaminase
MTVRSIKDKTLNQFLDELASKAATPGGGSAAAIMGSTSAALTSMVCNLTIGKPKYVEVEADMQALLQKSEALRKQFIGMIKADVESFDRVMAAYGLPKATEAEKNKRTEAIQQALKVATTAPLDCARASAVAISLSREAAEKGNTNVISDAGVAVMAGYAALKSAALNVYINAGAIKDKAFAQAKLDELELILKDSDVETEEIYQHVKNQL